MKVRTTIFSKSRDSMGVTVTDMGRKSEQVAGRGILATGWRDHAGFPLPWYHGPGQWEIEQRGERPWHKRRSNSQKPGRETVVPCSCWLKVIKEVENLRVSEESFRQCGRTFQRRGLIFGISGDFGIMFIKHFSCDVWVVAWTRFPLPWGLSYFFPQFLNIFNITKIIWIGCDDCFFYPFSNSIGCLTTILTISISVIRGARKMIIFLFHTFFV